MKFMKLGAKPDEFHAEGNSIRYVSSDLATDVIINVGEVKFFLHKYPLLSKSNRLQKLLLKANEENSDEINLVDFPGGPKAFEICAKFCYGMTVTLNPYNVVAARCASEYLEMTEDIERGNLVFKIEVVGRCIDSIASKTSVDPSNINWSYTYNRKLAVPDKIVECTMKFQEKDSIPKDWWVEDICELDIDLYKRVMITVKSKGRMDGNVIGEALKTYVVRWLPDSVHALASEVHNGRNKSLVETIICLLRAENGVGCSCSFLLKLLKVAILVGADDSSREDLINSIGLKLNEASVKDLLIPARSPQNTSYDVELVQCLVNRFVMHEKCRRSLNIVEKNEKVADVLVLGHGSWLNVGKLIDEYLGEIAADPNLALTSFIGLAQTVPKSARQIHDGLYKAIDIYLKEHLGLTKSERKNLCGLMDVKKLTVDASMHAAQNDRLPLRVVVQVLFFEQVRAAAGVQARNNSTHDASRTTTNMEEEWEKTMADDCKSLKKQTSQLNIKDEDFRKTGKLVKKSSKNRGSGVQLLPSRSRRIFDKLWVAGKGKGKGKGNGNAENKSSETSGSSQSPTSMIQGETKSSGSSSRNRRHSIS